MSKIEFVPLQCVCKQDLSQAALDDEGFLNYNGYFHCPGCGAICALDHRDDIYLTVAGFTEDFGVTQENIHQIGPVDRLTDSPEDEGNELDDCYLVIGQNPIQRLPD